MKLLEGLYDPGIFKAFFLAGGAGSGKTFIAGNAFAGTGLKFVNSDTVFENALRKAGLSLKMPTEEEGARDIVRARAKAVSNNMLDLYVRGRLGLVIDSTGRDYPTTLKQYTMLKQLLGYDCYMIFVNTSLEVALARNAKRERTVPEKIATDAWHAVQANIGHFQALFGSSNFIAVDNSKSDEDTTTMTISKINKVVRSLLRRPIQNHLALDWIQREKEARTANTLTKESVSYTYLIRNIL